MKYGDRVEHVDTLTRGTVLSVDDAYWTYVIWDGEQMAGRVWNEDFRRLSVLDQVAEVAAGFITFEEQVAKLRAENGYATD